MLSSTRQQHCPQEVLYHQKRFNDITILARLGNLTDMTGSLPDNWLAAARVVRVLADEAKQDLLTGYIWRLRTSTGYFAFDPLLHVLRAPPLYAELPLFGGDLATAAANYGALGTVIGAAAVRLIIEKVSLTPQTQ
ncbi:hypothetical protein V5799_019184 [Amblyomma americanum]|uniref:Uncharacterized protein n=1 Tax=Amblyomma americanum TaxID=6943 RepID=A0AAQ4D6P3_AMBAM